MLQNGKWNVTLKGTHIDLVLTSYNGKLKLSNGRYITEQQLGDYYKLGDKLPTDKSNYNIEWIINGKIRETIYMNASYALCKHKINKIKRNYPIGLLRLAKAI